MKLSDFDFYLPNELIAQTPSLKRDESKLLVALNDKIVDAEFKQIINYLNPGDVLVFNDSKVIKSKLEFYKDGKKISIHLHKKINDITWLAFAKPSRLLNASDEFSFDEHKLIISQKLNRGEIQTQFKLLNITIYQFLDKYGSVPLPPYIKNSDKNQDEQRYQTVYALKQGSVAAPTAGLHFTDELLKKIKDKGIIIAYVTLHVGAGTFLPIRTENIDEHLMHSEYYEITQETADIINSAKALDNKITTVGTTSLRTLESSTLDGKLIAGAKETDIFIKPGFKFKIVDQLITNFHLPKSTLFILVSAFAGQEQIKNIYKHAVEQKYRFFSYGDAMLLRSQQFNP